MIFFVWNSNIKTEPTKGCTFFYPVISFSISTVLFLFSFPALLQINLLFVCLDDTLLYSYNYKYDRCAHPASSSCLFYVCFAYNHL